MNEYVYIVLKNADFTEGRGPMLFHRVFYNLDLASQYVMSKDGIYGSEQKRSTTLSKSGRDYYNGYIIEKHKVLTKLYDNDEIKAMKNRKIELETELSVINNELNNV